MLTSDGIRVYSKPVNQGYYHVNQKCLRIYVAMNHRLIILVSMKLAQRLDARFCEH